MNKERASLYGALLNLNAWHDLETFAAHEIDASMRRMDAKSAADLSLGEVCEERGVRRGIRLILDEAKRRAQGL